MTEIRVERRTGTCAEWQILHDAKPTGLCSKDLTDLEEYAKGLAHGLAIGSGTGEDVTFSSCGARTPKQVFSGYPGMRPAPKTEDRK